MIQNLKIYLKFLFNFFMTFFYPMFYTKSFLLLFFNMNTKLFAKSEIIKRKYSYFLPFILAKYNHTISPDTEPIISYSFSMFLLSLLVLICFFNIIGYILSIYLISKYDIENKFPYFKRYIKFYSSTSKILLILEILIAFFF